jgi:RNA polymerase sigma-70 factor (ECF subfamily)
MEPSTPNVTQLLLEAQRGKRESLDMLLDVLYGELRRIAAGYFRGERPNHTLQPTALVHEAYVRLIDQRDVTWKNRAHFLGVAARVMRRLLVDHARKNSANKRGGELARVTLDDAVRAHESDACDILALNVALEALEAENERLAKIIELRYFGGMTIDETAEELGIATATVERDWKFARAWLRRQIEGGEAAVQ